MCRVDLGYIDKNGRLIIDRLEEVSPNYTPFDYYSAGNFSEGLARVCRNQKYGYVDLSGKEIIPCIYDAETQKIFRNYFIEFKKNMIKIFNLRTIKFKNRTFVNYEIF